VRRPTFPLRSRSCGRAGVKTRWSRGEKSETCDSPRRSAKRRPRPPRDPAQVACETSRHRASRLYPTRKTTATERARKVAGRALAKESPLSSIGAGAPGPAARTHAERRIARAPSLRGVGPARPSGERRRRASGPAWRSGDAAAALTAAPEEEASIDRPRCGRTGGRSNESSASARRRRDAAGRFADRRIRWKISDAEH
jgi:hypothetical protein